MGQPAAKQGDQITGTDVHIILVPTPGGPVPTPTPMPYTGIIQGGCSMNVLIGGLPAATVGSTATNVPPHLPIGGPFAIPPTNQATIIKGSATVLINKRPAARAGDVALTCNDPAPLPNGTVVAASTVLIGG
jgi:uncharacterized Zn-binding protein involved in type VI secretion